MESEVDSRLVSHQDGKWQVSHGPFESYDHLGETNWSLLVQAVNHWHEPTAALMRPFRELPDWRIDDLMISFSVPGGGVGPHSSSVRRVYHSGYRTPSLASGRKSCK
ncbi:cupin domain-containing protein [Escherichia coli]